MKKINLNEFKKSSSEVVYNSLIKIKGIGKWTINNYQLFVLEDCDAWPGGDLAVQEAIKSLKNLDVRPDENESNNIAEKWRPFRGLLLCCYGITTVKKMIKYDEIKNIIKIIEECSAVALTFYKQKHLEISIKDDNSPVTKADLEISRIATNKLSEMFPNDKIISEENITNLNEVDMTKYWLIDPIDGTKEFITKSGFFTINFALISNNKPVFGIICQPTTSSIWFNIIIKHIKLKKHITF